MANSCGCVLGDSNPGLAFEACAAGVEVRLILLADAGTQQERGGDEGEWDGKAALWVESDHGKPPRGEGPPCLVPQGGGRCWVGPIESGR